MSELDCKRQGEGGEREGEGGREGEREEEIGRWRERRR